MLSTPAGLSECLREWEDLEKNYQQIQDTHRLYKQKLEEVTKLQDSCSGAVARQRKKLKELAVSLAECKENHPTPKLSPEEMDAIAEIEDLMKDRANSFSEMEAFLPKKNGLYLTLVLGNVNVMLLNKQSKFAYKDEYEKFKLALTVILFVFSFTCRFVFSYRVLDALFNFLLVWYYCTLTIRESILISNGSRIKGWWVFHHYVSTFLSGVMLTWPEGTLYQMFRNQFLSYCLYQSFVQFLQYYYQSGCLYRLRALGERHNMDLTVVWAKVDVTMQDSVEVYLEDSAQIPCQYSFTDANSEPSFVMIQWFVGAVGSNLRTRIFYGDKSQQMVDNNTDYSGRINVTSHEQGTQLVIQDVRLSDERVFFCQVSGLAAGSAEGKTQLRVFAPPEPPVIEGVPTGISVTNEVPSKVASCEARNGFPKPNITWYRNNTPLTPEPRHVNVLTLVTRGSSGFYSVQSTLEYKVVKEDKDAHFSCEVSFFVPAAIRTVESNNINITVHYPTTMVELWKESPQGLVKEGDTVELRCQGDGNPPPPFIFNREQEPDVDLDSSGDVLILSPVSRKDSGIYQCRPLDADSHAEVKGDMQLTVHYLDPAVVVPKDSEVMLRGEDLTATCNALSSLKTSTVWYKAGQQVGQGNTLHLKDATYETMGEYVCEVTVPALPALHASGSVHIIVQGGPQLVGVEQEVQLEEAEGRMLNLSCEAQGHPLPSISWNIIGSQSWQEVVSRAGEHTTHSVMMVKVTSDVLAQCNASNDMGTEAKTFSIKAIPRLTSAAPFSPAEGSGVIIVVIILSLLLLAILGSVLYFLHKKGKIPCGRSGKQDITKEKTTKDDIVVEMRTNAKNEEAVLLKSVNGDKKGPNEQ